MATKFTRFLNRRKTSAQWTASNEVLLDGEIGIESDSNPRKFKIGDGSTPWNTLKYAAGEVDMTAINNELNKKVNNTLTINDKQLNSNVVLTKADIGLDLVNNTSDASKPISVAQKAAIDNLADNKVDKSIAINGKLLGSNITLTKNDIGLTQVDNTSDLNKPVSTAQQAAINAVTGGSIAATSLTMSPVANINRYDIGLAGTYTNLGNIQVTTADLNAGAVQIRRNGTTYSKVITPINLEAYAKKTDLNFKGQFQTIAEANTAIPNEINVATGKNNRDGKKVQIGSNGVYEEYSWVGDFNDYNLIKKNNTTKQNVAIRTKDSNLYINTKTGVASTTTAGTYNYVSFLRVYPGQKIYYTGVTRGGTTVSPDPSGVAGYAREDSASFDSTLDEFGIEKGALWDNRRYALKAGLSTITSPIYNQQVEITIPLDGSINFIRASSAKYDNGKNVIIEFDQNDDIPATSLKALPISLTEEKVNDTVSGVIVTSAAYHTSELIPVTPGQIIYFTGRIGGLRAQSQLPSGIAGYATNNLNSFITTPDASGLPIGNVFDIDRYANLTGQATITDIENGRKTFKDYPVKIPAGVNYITASSAFVDGIRVEISIAVGTKTVRDQIDALTKGLSNKGSIRNSVEVISHRGVVMGLAPENSLDAYVLSARAGYKIVETDVVPTSDGEIVLLHDDTIDRTLMNKSPYSAVTGSVYPNQRTLAQLRSDYVLKSPFINQRRPIPTFVEFLQLCQAYSLFPIIEFKDPGNTEASVLKTYNLAKRYLGKGNFAFSSFNSYFLDYIRTLDADVDLYYVNYESVDRMLTVKGIVYVDYRNVTEALIEECRLKNVEIVLWTVPRSRFDEFSKLGIRKMLSNDIAPRLTNQNVFYVDHTDRQFRNYTTNGNKDTFAGRVTLTANQTLTLNSDRLYNVPFGGIYLAIEIKGNAKIEINGINTPINNTSDDYVTYLFQSVIDNEVPYVTITGAGTGAIIKDVHLSISEY